MMRIKGDGSAERRLVKAFRRRYLRAMRSRSPQRRYETLAAQATARLSIGGVHVLCDVLKTERTRRRSRGEDRSADSLTAAIRALDSRVQVLDDLLY